jgi:O-antigen ligase
MLLDIKALIIVLAIAGTIFRLARPIVLQFTDARDLQLRRNVWLTLTVTAFLAPSFWWFTLVAAPLLVSAARRDTNPLALYAALLLVIPAISIEIPVVGINHLFTLDILRLLSICVLAPTGWRLWRAKQPRSRGLEAMDLLLLGFGALRIALYVPPDPAIVHNVVYENSFTNVLRSTFLFFVDIGVPYFVVSRLCTNRRLLTEILAWFCLACVVLAPIAVFESARHWLLYAGIGPRWGVPLPVDTYYMRAGQLRAQATAGHAITLGYLLDVALGFWLYLQARVPATSSSAKVGVPVILSFGLLVTYARAPWLVAVVVYFAFVALRSRSLPRLFKTACAAGLVVVAVAVSPVGYRIIRLLPFVGESPASDNSLQYRERLADRSWQLIQEHPFFGQQMIYSQMEDLRQGQGIIDFVNAYAQIALFYGCVGLLLFLGFVFIAVARVYRATSEVVHKDPELASIGRCLLATMFGTLLLIATGNLQGLTEKVFYLLAGLLFAYAHLPRGEQATAPSPAARAWISTKG